MESRTRRDGNAVLWNVSFQTPIPGSGVPSGYRKERSTLRGQHGLIRDVDLTIK